VPGKFIALADLLCPPPVEPVAAFESQVEPILPDAPRESDDCSYAAVSDARRFRAALADVLAHAAASLVRELASDVLARELNVAPCDMDALIARLLSDHLSASPLRVRISPHDRITTNDFPVVIDDSLQPGDAILECANGAIDARLGVRLADVIERASNLE
jgi:flagellar biosynthesis/type III secretory pathway protein FliH